MGTYSWQVLARSTSTCVLHQAYAAACGPSRHLMHRQALLVRCMYSVVACFVYHCVQVPFLKMLGGTVLSLREARWGWVGAWVVMFAELVAVGMCVNQKCIEVCI